MWLHGSLSTMQESEVGQAKSTAIGGPVAGLHASSRAKIARIASPVCEAPLQSSHIAHAQVFPLTPV